MKVKVLVSQSCLVLCDPVSLPGSSVLGILQARYWRELPFPLPGDFPHPEIESGRLALQADHLPSDPPEKLSVQRFHGNPVF